MRAPGRGGERRLAGVRWGGVEPWCSCGRGVTSYDDRPVRPTVTIRSKARAACVGTMARVCDNRAEHCINNNRKVSLPSLERTLVNRNYAKLWYGQAVSALGGTVFGTTLVLWGSQVLARRLRGAPAAVSGILVAAGAAVALVGPVAGVFVDRWNRKSTMMRTEVIRAAMVAGLRGLSFVPARDLPIGLWLAAVYLVVFVLNAAGQFFSPARFATTGDVVQGEEDRARAAGLAEATTSAAGIVGPPIAALLLFTVGVQ